MDTRGRVSTRRPPLSLLVFPWVMCTILSILTSMGPLKMFHIHQNRHSWRYHIPMLYMLWVISSTFLNGHGTGYSPKLSLSASLSIIAGYTSWSYLWFLLAAQSAFSPLPPAVAETLQPGLAFSFTQTKCSKLQRCKPLYPLGGSFSIFQGTNAVLLVWKRAKAHICITPGYPRLLSHGRWKQSNLLLSKNPTQTVLLFNCWSRHTGFLQSSYNLPEENLGRNVDWTSKCG